MKGPGFSHIKKDSPARPSEWALGQGRELLTPWKGPQSYSERYSEASLTQERQYPGMGLGVKVGSEPVLSDPFPRLSGNPLPLQVIQVTFQQHGFELHSHLSSYCFQ